MIVHRSGNAGNRAGQHDLEQAAHVAAAVDSCSFQQFIGNGNKEGHDQHGGKCSHDLRQNDTCVGVNQTQLTDDQEGGNNGNNNTLQANINIAIFL